MTDSQPKVGSNVDADSFGPAWFLERHDVKPTSTEQMMSTYQDGGRFGSSAGKRRTDFGGRHRHFCISGVLSAHGSPCWWASTSNKLTELVHVWEDNLADSVIGSRDGTTNLDDTTEHGISRDESGWCIVQKARMSMHHVGWLQTGSLFATAERRGSLMRLCGERCGGAQLFHRQTEWRKHSLFEFSIRSCSRRRSKLAYSLMGSHVWILARLNLALW